MEQQQQQQQQEQQGADIVDLAASSDDDARAGSGGVGGAAKKGRTNTVSTANGSADGLAAESRRGVKKKSGTSAPADPAVQGSKRSGRGREAAGKKPGGGSGLSAAGRQSSVRSHPDAEEI